MRELEQDCDQWFQEKKEQNVKRKENSILMWHWFTDNSMSHQHKSISVFKES